YDVTFDSINPTEPGLYRLKQEEIINNGIIDHVSTRSMYFLIKNWSHMNKGPDYGVGMPVTDLTVNFMPLLAGIDPEQEAMVVGLDEAILQLGKGSHFTDNDEVSYSEITNVHHFPVIISTHSYVDKDVNFTLEKLTLDFSSTEIADETMEMVREEGGANYLDTIEGEELERYSYTADEAFRMYVNSMSGIDMETGEPFVSDYGFQDDRVAIWMPFRPSPVSYQPVASPYVDRWPFAYEVEKVFNQSDDDVGEAFKNIETFREPLNFGTNSDDWPRVHPKWIGFYNPSKLDISQ